MAWFLLFCAGLLEIAWAYAMKKSDGFNVLAPSVATIALMIASFLLLAISMRSLPLGTAYCVWTGIGAFGTFLIGIVLLGEVVTPARLLAAGLIVSGIVLMKLSSA